MARGTTAKSPTSLALGSQQQQHQQLHAPYLFQEALPTEIWRLVLLHVPTLDLFSLYNTSRYMRTVSASPLVQAMASKSLRLFFYQEYVRRVGVRFVFESFDLETDRVIFRPLVADNQYRFRTGITLQNPQLEEVAVKSTGSEIDHTRVMCSRGRYFTIKPVVRTPPSLPQPLLQDVSHSQEDTVEQDADGDAEGDMDLSADGPEAAVTATEAAAPDTVTNLSTTTGPAPPTMTTRKLTADEKVYLGTKNFLDKACPVPVRKTGICKVDGTRYSFLQTYPWSLQYQVENEVMGPHVSQEDDSRLDSNSKSCSSNNGKGKAVEYLTGNTGKNSRFGNKDDQTMTDSQLHQPLSNEHMDSCRRSSSGSGSGNISSSNSHPNPSTTMSRRGKSPEMTEKNADSSAGNSRSSNNNSSNGPRFLRALRFECSMNFLDPKRATRNVLGRWLEGKMYQWSKVLGGKKPSSQQPQLYLRQQKQQQDKPKDKQKQKPSLHRKRHQQEQERRSDATGTGRSSTTSLVHQSSPSSSTVAVNEPGASPLVPRRRGRVIRAIDILLGPTDRDGSSVDHQRVRRQSSSTSLNILHHPSDGHNNLPNSSPNQGDASIAGGRCMIPAIDLLQMGSSSTSATF
ncbi:MAG: hypothetical protein J3R72DRAFT_435115 [Linnemannia gamsii]|nr:MAG: hypothetical protein J3R72DRAFT_435115 [Linnemannia gamsii]